MKIKLSKPLEIAPAVGTEPAKAIDELDLKLEQMTGADIKRSYGLRRTVLELDDETVHLKAGDVLVQRGTIHNWVNKGTQPCVIAFTLVAAKSVTAGGKVLPAHG